ncbi:hypothetical protein LCGC14_2613870, partial [marine sediment metagenome]
ATTVEVPPAYIGKISTESGLQQGTIPPSRIRISGWCVTCETLVIAEAADYPVEESLQIFMPKDQLNLVVEVRGVFAINPAEDNINRVFDHIPAQPLPDGMGLQGKAKIKVIPMSRVYDTYGKPVIRELVRTYITRYSIAEVMSNRESIGAELRDAVAARLAPTPLQPMYFGLADIQPPDIIVTAQEKAKQREIELKEAEAQKEIDVKRASARLEVAEKQQAVDLLEAETQVMVNDKLASSVSEPFMWLRYLRFLQTLAENDSKTLVMPLEAMQSFGAQMRAWGFGDEAAITVVPVQPSTPPAIDQTGPPEVK